MPEHHGPRRIVLADDHAVVREGLRRLLQGDDRFEVVGEARDGREAVAEALRLRPDVLVLDVSMPHMNGLEALRELKNKANGAPVRSLLLTAAIDRAAMLNAVQLGARGIILKTAATETLLDGIVAVVEGDYWLDRERIGNYLDLANRLNGGRPGGMPFDLTVRQREIIQGIVDGLNNREIAERLGISEHTAKHHLTQAFNKMGVSTRVELALLARKQGLVDP